MGADTIEECNRLKIVVDVAHAGAATLQAALKSPGNRSSFPILNLEGMVKPSIRHGFPNRSPNRMPKPWRMEVASLESGRKAQKKGGVRQIHQSWLWTRIGVNHVGIGTDTDLLSPRPGGQDKIERGRE